MPGTKKKSRYWLQVVLGQLWPAGQQLGQTGTEHELYLYYSVKRSKLFITYFDERVQWLHFFWRFLTWSVCCLQERLVFLCRRQPRVQSAGKTKISWLKESSRLNGKLLMDYFPRTKSHTLVKDNQRDRNTTSGDRTIIVVNAKSLNNAIP